MAIRCASVAGLVLLAALVFSGCSGGKTEDPRESGAARQYADPGPSPIAVEEVAAKLRTYFAEGELASQARSGSSSANVVGSANWSIEAHQDLFPSHGLEMTAGWQRTCEDAVGRYLKDLAQQCAALEGEMSIGKVEPSDVGFRIEASYSLPPADACDGRSGKIVVELRDHAEEQRKVIAVMMNENARGRELPAE